MDETDIRSRPEAIEQVRRFSRRLYKSRKDLIPSIRSAAKATDMRRAAMDLATHFPFIKLLGVLAGLSMEDRISLLIEEGELTDNEALDAIDALEALDESLDLQRALTQVLPSWFGAVAGPRQIAISIIYSKPEACQELSARLAILSRQKLISVNSFKPRGADLIVVLVDSTLLGNENAYSRVLEAMSYYERGMARVIPVLLEPTDLSGTPLDKLQILPKNNIPIASWAKSAEAWYDVAKSIRQVVEGFSTQQRPGSTDIPLTCVLYDRSDVELFQELAPHLALLEKNQMMRLWHPQLVTPGDRVDEQARMQLQQAALIVVLLSANFLSDPAMDELTELVVQRATADKRVLLTVVARPVDVTLTPYSNFQPVSDVTTILHEDRDLLWLTIAKELRERLKQLGQW